MSYALMDSGACKKLERFGPFVLVRPCSFAFWDPQLPQNVWKKADAHFTRIGKGSWQYLQKKLPDEWTIELEGLHLIVRPTPFGHVGLFPEHRHLWKLVAQRIKPGMRVLNLFAYSGAMTLTAAKKGAQVTHVDASSGIVDWAKENAKKNGIGNIRWIVDDVVKFLQRLKKRNEKFDAIILDPPTFGRGNKGEVFKIETDLAKILSLNVDLLTPNPALLLLSCHTPGFTPILLKQLLQQKTESKGGNIQAEELFLSGPFLLPSGAYALWTP